MLVFLLFPLAQIAVMHTVTTTRRAIVPPPDVPAIIMILDENLSESVVLASLVDGSVLTIDERSSSSPGSVKGVRSVTVASSFGASIMEY